ncbi:MAG: hypothetical protein R3F14_29080 [Polyangiaceae bacterium]
MDSTKPAVWKSYLLAHPPRSGACCPRRSTTRASACRRRSPGRSSARWKRCVAATDGALGEALAQPFVKKHFTPAAKEATEKYVAEIGRAFGAELEKLAWMDKATKEKAREKLAKMAYLIGYPSKWRTYDFTVDAKSWAKTALAARAFQFKDDLRAGRQARGSRRWGRRPPP